MPTHDENVSPWPLCENLLARPCSPPLCASRPLRTPMSGAAWPEASLFPLIAPSIESSNPIVFFLRYYVWFSGRPTYECVRRTINKLSEQVGAWARQKQKERRPSSEPVREDGGFQAFVSPLILSK